jgi:hypothetical protein
MSPVDPFKGLARFEDTDEDAALFFSRGRDRDVVVANLMASRLTVLYGESGVGKSSLLRAGVAHHLRRSGEPAIVVVFDAWQSEPLRALEQALADAAGIEPLASLADTIDACSTCTSSSTSSTSTSSTPRQAPEPSPTSFRPPSPARACVRAS